MRRTFELASAFAIPFAIVVSACSASEFGPAVDSGADGAAKDDAATADDRVTEPDHDAGSTTDAKPVFDSGTASLAPDLGTSSPFVVLSGATVTNSGTATFLEGDLGTTGPTVTGLTGKPSQPTGSTAINDARAIKALLDVGTAYDALTAKTCPPANDLSGLDLGGMTLAPGVYCFSAAASQLPATTLTFDAKGDPNATWIIRVGTALTVMDGAHAVIVGGPPSLGCRIFWTMGTAATLNGNVQWIGTLLASAATGLLTSAKLSPGRIFARTGGITLLSNEVSAAACQ
ncbi:hypothetical protein BH09MYX1_BH09MYX1_11550 [soil metagenome]